MAYGPSTGRATDVTMFLKTKLFFNPERYLSEGELIIYDSGLTGQDGYADYLFLPIKTQVSNHEYTDEFQMLVGIFNSTRVVIENVFGRIKKRFGICEKYTLSRYKSYEIFRSVFILHNIINVRDPVRFIDFD